MKSQQILSDIVRGSQIIAIALGICAGIGLVLAGPILLIELLGTSWWLALYSLHLLAAIWFIGMIVRRGETCE